jgi:rSAM/selenodomain-associated transferase 1
MNAIVIMAREPVPGNVKTRLVPPLNPNIAAKLYNAFLLDKIEQVRRIQEVDHFIAFTPSKSKSFFKKMSYPGFSLIPQNGSDLGERLDNVSAYLFKDGYKKVVITDSDSPNLPIKFIIESLDILDDSDIVLGPTVDGGYYLIGLKDRIPAIFQDIPWSTSKVAAITIEKATRQGKKISKLKEWYDVDTIEDINRLKDDLKLKFRDPEERSSCWNTITIMDKILK